MRQRRKFLIHEKAKGFCLFQITHVSHSLYTNTKTQTLQTDMQREMDSVYLSSNLKTNNIDQSAVQDKTPK